MSEFLGVMLRTEDIESGTHCNTRVYFACHPYIKFKIQSHTRTFFEPERIRNQESFHSFSEKSIINSYPNIPMYQYLFLMLILLHHNESDSGVDESYAFRCVI